ncbi:glucosamine-6-phosphate deaminase [Parapedobacter sp. 10938]|uniref:glucosamine-6-phosphate deaminase n=1 Tax=Parapedobacter flavus TaxID=3110225 RepID=UPI002DBBDA2A|nr:glucosamine-6-phosphate deaminase [Parapedobacter sp. 10938]MEC3880453.1 glucosamine-6-phosphate deaminase [Parapedobacter sp. 10938]
MMDKKVDSLVVKQFDSRVEMGEAAAQEMAKTLLDLLATQSTVNMIFAAAPSQNEFLAALVRREDIDWKRVNAFHMDEYVGLPIDATQRFGNFLRDRLFSKLPFRSVNYLDGSAADVDGECQRYANLLGENPVDIVCMGIGENCHIAFNDPHVADFADPAWVKVVDLDNACRQQQVNDNCFGMLSDVPTHALTLTIPALMAADHIFCIVPGTNKADAVRYTLLHAITPLYPSTILRSHRNAILYMDKESASKL